MLHELGKIIEVDLTDQSIKTSDFPKEDAQRFLGGRGLGAWFIYRNIEDKISALAPENIIIFSCGLLTGSRVTSGARLHINTISPLTHILGSSNVGGSFGTKFYSTGIMCMIVRGRSKHPVYIAIKNNHVGIESADNLWGLDTWETERKLKNDHPNIPFSVLSIGPAGENLVPIACAISDTHRAAGRTGIGAVMGSKYLKAVVVTGKTRHQKPTRKQSLAIKKYAAKIRNAPLYETFSTYSNFAFVLPINKKGMLSTHNYREIRFDGAERIDGTHIQRYVKQAKTCPRCPVHCKAEVQIAHGKYAGTTGARPDLEPIIALGPKCGLSDPEALLHLHNLCNRLGLDVISAGSCIAFAMDLKDRGVLLPEHSDNMCLAWGNAESMEALICAMAQRKGTGKIFAEGVREAARIIGSGAEQVAYHSKGLELTGYDPRGMMGVALGYAVSSRGGDFCSVYNIPESRFTPDRAKSEFGTDEAVDRFALRGKAALIKRCLTVSAVIDSLGICKVPALSLIGEFDLKNEAELVNLFMGYAMSAEDLLLIGERIIDIERLVNIRHDGDALVDTIPEHFLNDAILSGPAKGSRVNLKSMLKEFYEIMVWDEKGRPKRATLRRLGIT